MSDELERILHKSSPQRRPTPINPHLRKVPRVQGGPPLTGGPKLELVIPSDDELEDRVTETPQTLQRPTPEKTFVHDHPPLFNGPHYNPPEEKQEEPENFEQIEDIAQEENEVAAPVTIIPIPAAASAPPPPATVAAPTVVAKPVDEGIQHLHTTNLHKSYRKGPIEVQVLCGVNVKIRQGEFLAIEGQSGSGKSTLLHLMGTLDAPDKGEIYMHGQRIDNLPSRNRDRIRNKTIGMIFQFYHLLPELSTLENVLSPLMIAEGAWSYWKHRKTHREKAKALLKLVGLSHRLKHKPSELSGGEMQRTAIARALIAEPELLLADEPTGNLDPTTGQEILHILRTLNRERNLTIVMVTHDQSLAQQADRIIRLKGGLIEE
jgi:lipoprotein-releasing system ATP-binding protein